MLWNISNCTKKIFSLLQTLICVWMSSIKQALTPVTQCNEYFKIKTCRIKPQIIISSVPQSPYRHTTYPAQRTSAYLTTHPQSQSGQPHRGCLTYTIRKHFQVMMYGTNPSQASKWPAALVCIQDIMGVCVHQWEGGETGDRDEVEGKRRERRKSLHPLPGEKHVRWE